MEVLQSPSNMTCHGRVVDMNLNTSDGANTLSDIEGNPTDKQKLESSDSELVKGVTEKFLNNLKICFQAAKGQWDLNAHLPAWTNSH